MDTKIKKLFALAVANKASDIHLTEGMVPRIRVNGELLEVTNLGEGEIIISRQMILSVMETEKAARLEAERELDFSLEVDEGRFRCNFYYQRDLLSAAFRVVNNRIPGMAELGLPQIMSSFLNLKQGFVLVTGPTGQGKSTTVASVLNEINIARSCHIVTIEDPIEYMIKPVKSIISQREIGSDSLSFEKSLRSCLRQDPNVVFVGEMRDLETISLALTVAETGHLVFSTLHTNSAPQTVDRIIDVFPEDSKSQVRIQLASVISAIISQRLIPTVDGGRVAVFEVMMATPAIRNAIRENKTFMIDNIIQTSVDAGMVTLEMALARLVKNGKISEESAMNHSLRPAELQNYLRSIR